MKKSEYILKSMQMIFNWRKISKFWYLLNSVYPSDFISQDFILSY